MEQPNLHYINELSGDNQEFKAKLISILKEELPKEIQGYSKEIKNLSYYDASQSVHKLKHKISILGLEKSYYLAEEYEGNLINENAFLRLEFDTILKSMQEFVNSL